MSGALSLKLTGVSLRYPEEEREVLGSIDLEVGGGITVLMGENGSGKSSLMNICALLTNPTTGSVTYTEAGRELGHDLALRRRISMVIPRGGIFNRSVCANAAYGLRVRGLRGAELRDRAHEALERVGLIDKLRQNALSLSSGEAQRLALARAMAIRPQMLLLDEPTASVDEDNTAIIEDIIGSLSSEMTIVMATHDRGQAGRLGGRVVRLSRGRIVSS